MHYSTVLKNEVAAERHRLQNADEWRTQFLAHLQSEKFQGFDANGDRKDWICVSDVAAWLVSLQDILHD